MAQRLPLLRRSDIESFGCPYRYDLLVNQGADDTGDEAIRGRAVHAAHLVYVLLLVQHQVPQDFELAKEAFVQGLAISPVPDHLIDECERLFFRHVEHFELDLAAYVSAEEIHGHDERGGRRWQPDLLYARPQELEIIDIKTYYKALTKKQALKELQLRWYLLEALKAYPGFPRYRFTFWFIRLNVIVSLAFTPEEIEAFEPGVHAQILTVERAHETGHYPALPGAHCQLCRLACPVQDEEYRLPGRIKDLEQAIDIGGRILAKSQELKQLRKVMGGWCQVEGPVDVNGQTFEYQAMEARSVQAGVVFDVLAEAGIDPDDVGLTFSGEVMNKILERRELTDDQRRRIEAASWGKTTYRLRHRKSGEHQPKGTHDVLGGTDDD